MTAKTKPNFSYFKRIAVHRLCQLRCARQVHCWTKSASHPDNDQIAPEIRPARHAACLYKTAPAIHRLPAPRCPWSGSSFSGQAPCTAFPWRSISPCSWRSNVPRPRESRNGAGRGRGLGPSVRRSGRVRGMRASHLHRPARRLN